MSLDHVLLGQSPLTKHPEIFLPYERMPLLYRSAVARHSKLYSTKELVDYHREQKIPLNCYTMAKDLTEVKDKTMELPFDEHW